MKRALAIILCIITLMTICISAYAAGITKESNSVKTHPKTYGEIPVRMAEASSELIDDGLVYQAERAVDGSTGTCWAEGASGYGIGETITLYLNGIYDVSKFSIAGGWTINKELYDHNAKPKVMYVYFSSSPYEHYVVSLDETMSTQSFQVDENGVEWVQFEIVDVYPGEKDVYDTCISEITLYGK